MVNSQNPSNRTILYDTLTSIAQNGTRLARTGFGTLSVQDTEYKTPGDPVTTFDKTIESMARAEIAAFDVAVTGEEQGVDEGNSPLRLYIDPIDGTKSYIRGFPGAATSYGLTERGKLIFGAVGDIGTQTLYVAQQDLSGVWKTHRHNLGEPQQSTPSIVHPHGLPKQYFAVNGEDASYELGAKIKKEFDANVQVGGIAAALALTQVACGIFDGAVYLSRDGAKQTSPYDVAAGIAMLQATGATYSRLDGTPYDWLTPVGGLLVARESGVHASLLRLVNSS